MTSLPQLPIRELCLFGKIIPARQLDVLNNSSSGPVLEKIFRGCQDSSCQIGNFNSNCINQSCLKTIFQIKYDAQIAILEGRG